MPRPSLRDFELAKCELYRTPEVRLTKLSTIIDERIAEMWKHGTSAENAATYLTTDAKITGAIKDQIAESIAFQKEQKLENLTYQEQEEIRRQETKLQEELAKAKAKAEAEKAQAEQVIGAVTEEVTQKQVAYSATSSRLAEMRAKIRKQLDELGGEESLELLEEIDEEIQTEPTSTLEQKVVKPNEAPTTYRKRPRTPRKPRIKKPYSPWYEVGPLKKLRESKGVVGKIYRVFTYKVF